MALLVQSASNKAASATSLTLTLGTAATPGNCLVVALGCDASTARTVSNTKIGGVADNFALAEGKAFATYTQGYSAIWTDQNLGTSSTSVVITMSGSCTNLSAWIMEWSGIALSGAVDKTNGTTGNGTWTSGATGTLTNASELIVGVTTCLAESGTASITGPSSPWTNLSAITQGDTGVMAGYKLVTSTATQTYNGTFTGGAIQESVATIISLKLLPPPVAALPVSVNQSVMRAAIW